MSSWKNLIFVTIAVLALLYLAGGAEAGWLIDHERFHVSVHGQLSCQDCHGGIVEKNRHPDPVDVNRNLTDFFDPEQCTDCHETVFEETAEGHHGGQEVTSHQGFDVCIECHHPHYQAAISSETTEVDLSRPAAEKCSQCHDLQDELPDFSDEDLPCLQCHLDVAGDEARAEEQTRALCLHCHGSENRQADSFALIDEKHYAATPHADVNCLVCHPQAAAFDHLNQAPGECSQCHRPHDEKMTHDLHSAVTCGACHLNGITPQRDAASRHIGWHSPGRSDRISPVHRMQIPSKDDSCRACHTGGNTIGASAMLLPAKSVICMPCHAATLSVGDSVTVLSLVFFLAGMVVTGSVWFAGGEQRLGSLAKLIRSIGEVLGAVFSSRLPAIVGSLVLDGLLQRRLYRISRERWLLHTLIFFPFLFRLVWGLLALIASLQWPQWEGTWDMLDKNHPLTAFLFDLSGILPIVGVCGVIMRRVQRRSEGGVTGLPPADWPAYSLLGGIMIVGFILEGMRMAMTGSPDGASYAFVGDAISRLLAGYELTGFYGYVWYLHAILTGAFIVYLPFSRMLHMIMAPVVMAMNTASDAHRYKVIKV